MRAMTEDVLALYDRDERAQARFPDTRREELPHLVRHIDLLGHTGTVLYSRLDETNADAAIREQMAYFGGLGQQLEWKAYAHDRPADLVQRLAAQGFRPDEREAILVLDVQVAPAALLAPPTRPVRRLTDAAELRAIGPIRRGVYGTSGDTVERLAREMAADPEYLSVYLAEMDGQPAACGWIRFPRQSAFASLWGGSTLPALRGRGLYTSLLAARVREARARGVRYLTVDARPMSRPILERRGFQLLTHATACTWSASA
jgi:GNAT superfamily N-acetyltransferase